MITYASIVLYVLGALAQEPLVAPLSVSSPAEPATLQLGSERGGALRLPSDSGWTEFELTVPVTGRYRCTFDLAAARPTGDTPVTVWIEDHVGNPDGRHYDVTGPTAAAPEGCRVARDGSPLAAGNHRMRLHHAGGEVDVLSVSFSLLIEHQLTPTSHVQSVDGTEWALVWSDEFDGEGPPDPAHWTYDVGDWGWGNRELQYYTARRPENARVTDGHLVIQARRNDIGHPWTSARLTTRGKRAFLYGRMEFRAKVPALDGAWAAGWLLGDAFRDERSWPYCGEIDVVEGVGREIDDVSGDGRNHASCHTRAYYFKQGNHISNTIAVSRMATEFHDYWLEWYRDRVVIGVDDETYYVYDKTNGPLEWPFAEPQNLILNLAMGGGMGGAVDPDGADPEFVIDYVRVFGRR
jgi:beta-glucanase (GH16 family)